MKLFKRDAVTVSPLAVFRIAVAALATGGNGWIALWTGSRSTGKFHPVLWPVFLYWAVAGSSLGQDILHGAKPKILTHSFAIRHPSRYASSLPE